MPVAEKLKHLDDATIERCRSEAAFLSDQVPFIGSEPVDWFAVLVDQAYKETTEPLSGWFCWWDE